MKQKHIDVKKSELKRYVGAENEDCKDPSFDILDCEKENLQSITSFFIWLKIY